MSQIRYPDPGGKVTVTQGDRVITGTLKCISGSCEDDGYDVMEMEIFPDRITDSEIRIGARTIIQTDHSDHMHIGRGLVTDFGGCSPSFAEYYNRVNDEQEENDMEAHLIHNERNRTTDIAIEVREDVFLDPEGNEIERGRGEEMPIFLPGLDDGILTAIRRA